MRHKSKNSLTQWAVRYWDVYRTNNQERWKKRFIILNKRFNSNIPGSGAKRPSRYVLYHNFLVAHPNFMKFGDFS